MINNKKLVVTIAVAAYAAEKNIVRLIESLLAQEENDSFVIDKILIHCDKSGDKTAELSRSVVHPKLQIIEPEERLGYAGSMKNIFFLIKDETDILVTVNDDIYISSDFLVDKITDAFYSNPEVGMVCARVVPMKAVNFVESVGAVAYEVWHKERMSKAKGQNALSVDGKVMSFRINHLEAFKWPEDLSLLSTVDLYFYLWFKSQGFAYVFVYEPVAYFKNPTTWKDLLTWRIRDSIAPKYLRQTFGNLIDVEYAKPDGFYLKHFIIQFFRTPLEITVLYFFDKVVRFRAKKKSADAFDPLWESISTTKREIND